MNILPPEERHGRPWRILLGRLGLIVAVLVTLAWAAPRLSFIEVRTFDFLWMLHSHAAMSPIEMIDIGTDDSVYEAWRDPHESAEDGCGKPRLIYAEAVRRLHRWGAKVIVFDIMFRRHCQYEDARVAEAFRQAGNVVVAAPTEAVPGALKLDEPTASLASSVWGIGSPATHQPNETTRSIPLLAQDRDTGTVYEALSLLAFKRFIGAKVTDRDIDTSGSFKTAGIVIPTLIEERIYLLRSGNKDTPRTAATTTPTDDSGISVVEGDVQRLPQLTSQHAMLINWAGPAGTFTRRALIDVLELDDTQGRAIYHGKAIIIGQLDWDAHWTALGAMPGPEIHANALHTLISRSFLRPISSGGFFGILFLFCIATAMTVRRFKGIRELGLMLLILAAAVLLARQLFVLWGIWMYLFFCVFGILLTWGLTTFLESGAAAVLLGRFVPAFIGKPGTEGLREIRTLEAALLFSDIRGFTGTAERLSATDIMRLLNHYQATVEEIVTRYGGTIVKTPGDAVLAVFWKKAGPFNYSTCAVRSGQEMIESIPLQARTWEAAGVNLQIGVGVNAGEVAMGLVGTHHLEPTVIGDPVNVAQRLESLTKTLHYPLIFSDTVREQLPDDVACRFIDEVTVTGRTTPVPIYTLADVERSVPHVTHSSMKESDE